MTQIVTTVSGFPEMSFWRDEYLCKNISAANQAVLCNIKFANDKSMTGNFETLFNITQGKESGYADPMPNSLYNIQTLKNILDAGENSINIMEPENQNKTFEEAIQGRKEQWVSIS